MKTVPSLPAEQLAAMKQEYSELLLSTARPGIDRLASYLEQETDFFTAPASTQFHGAVAGGLLAHSLTVYKLLVNFCKSLPNVPKESMILAALLHDLCKTNFYVTRIKNVKIAGEKRWEEEEFYAVEDALPLGHGEKSLYLAMRFIPLDENEAAAIRWHMGGYDDAARSYAGGMAQSGAFRKYPMAAAMSIADLYATYLMNV
ncbi:MAG: HD domain-containing protein [Christensenellales bacterium]